VKELGEAKLRELFRGPFSAWMRVLDGEEEPRAVVSQQGDRYSPLSFGGEGQAWQTVDSVLELVQR
jgi:hypothetical protein